MFDSLNRHMLGPYGCDWTVTPNFARLAKRTATFDNSYVCSMPCMPARRELHTGRPNFLHRAWGPLEPFDDSVFEILKNNKIHTHLATDHYHYFEDGGATYHPRYSTWEFFRGQEGDPWIGDVNPAAPPVNINPPNREQDWINRSVIKREEDHSQSRTFEAGLNFISRNHSADNWVLQIETFDPHEPFFSLDRFKELYSHDYEGPVFDWPGYCGVKETPEQVDHCRREYAALVSQCDESLGKVLDAMDRYDLWKDTMLIVWTDHGFHLGEREMWAKCWMGWYQPTAHTPFFVWDPRGGQKNVRRDSLVQPAIDIAPTLLGLFGIEKTKDMLGHDLREAIASDTPVRQAAMYGMWGREINVTDGRYTYMRAPVSDDAPCFNYTLMPTKMRERFSPEELVGATLTSDLPFTKGAPVLRIPRHVAANPATVRHHQLYDLRSDPGEQQSLKDPAVEEMMKRHLVRLMTEAHAPREQFERFDLPI